MSFGDHVPFGKPAPETPTPGGAENLSPPAFGRLRIGGREGFLVQLASNVTGRSGPTLGSGTGYVLTLSGTTLTASTQLITVYNASEDSVSQLLPDSTSRVLPAQMINGVPMVNAAPGSSGSSAGILFTLDATLEVTHASQASCPIVAWWGIDPGVGTATVFNLPSGDGAGHYVFYGEAGNYGLADWDSNAGEYRIYAVEHIAEIVQATTTAAMSGGSCASTTDGYWDGSNPGDQTLYDSQGLFPTMLSGAKTTNRWDAVNRQYEIIEGQSKAGRLCVTLSANISSGSATAAINTATGGATYFGTQQDVQSPTGTITVYDPWGATGPFASARSGAKAWVTLDAKNNKYWIDECERLGVRFRATLGADLASADSTVAVTLTDVLSQFPFTQIPFTQMPASTSVTGNNYMSLAGSSGDTCEIAYDGSNYYISNVQHHVQTEVTDIQYDSTGHEIQVKTRDIACMPNGAESSWTNKISLTQITYASAVTWDGSALAYTTRTVYAFSDASDSSHTVDTTVACS